jgi:hypothetical protein
MHSIDVKRIISNQISGEVFLEEPYYRSIIRQVDKSLSGFKNNFGHDPSHAHKILGDDHDVHADGKHKVINGLRKKYHLRYIQSA